MAAKLQKTTTRETSITFEGQPLVITLDPDLKATIKVKGRKTTVLNVNLAELYLNSRHMDGKEGRSRKQFALREKEIVVVPKSTDGIVQTTPFPPAVMQGENTPSTELVN